MERRKGNMEVPNPFRRADVLLRQPHLFWHFVMAKINLYIYLLYSAKYSPSVAFFTNGELWCHCGKHCAVALDRGCVCVCCLHSYSCKLKTLKRKTVRNIRHLFIHANTKTLQLLFFFLCMYAYKLYILMLIKCFCPKVK